MEAAAASYGDIHKQTLAKDTAVMQYYDTSMLGNRDAKSTGGIKYETMKISFIIVVPS